MKKTVSKILYIVFPILMFGLFSQCTAQKKATNTVQNTVKATPINETESSIF